MRKGLPVIGYTTAICLIIFALSCKKNTESVSKIFEKVEVENSGVDFVNTVPENDTLNQNLYHYLFNGNGMGCGDLNNDGLADLVVSGNARPAEIYLNKGDFKFEKITEKSGVKTSGFMTGVSLADVNNDGFMDIYICKSGPSKNPKDKQNYLFINNKNLTFTESAEKWGIADGGNTTCATFFDLENDGDLDLYIGNHSVKFFADIEKQWTAEAFMDETNAQHLYRNDGNKFTDISKESGILGAGYCLSATAADFNKDGLTDLYVCHDYHFPDRYWINKGDGKMEEAHFSHFAHASNNSMGADAADYNNDGFMDLITLDMLVEDPRRFSLFAGPNSYEFFTLAVKNGYGKQFMHNALQTNNGDGTFSDLAFLNGVAATDWSWSPLFADFDNDGNKDLFISNGYYRDVTNMDFIEFQNLKSKKENKKVTTKEVLEKLPHEKIMNYTFRNRGNYHFDNVSSEWGIDEPSLSTSAIYNDLNNDGQLDIIISNQGEPISIYKNNNQAGAFINVACKGGKKNNINGIGCKVLVKTDSFESIYEMQHTHGYQSSTEARIHIGLGTQEKINELTVIWPDATFQTLKNIEKNTNILFNETDAKGKWDYTVKTEYAFEEVIDCGLNFTHEETNSNDFKQQFVLPHWFSRLGPGIATGDVNGDNLQDILITNGYKSSGTKLFLQKENGKFILNSSQPWSNFAADALGCILFDADNDQDLDCYMVEGGSERGWGEGVQYLHHFYTNDGKGNFTEARNKIPNINCSSSCITAADYDSDGDIDLFVGGRLLPQYYPNPKIRSYLLRNDKGSFTDVTAQVAPDLQESAMIFAASFCDWNGDNKPDLVVSGEYIKVSFLANENGKFVYKDAASPKLQGWYNSLLPMDIDNDGDLDMVCGNKGNNSFLQAGNGKSVGVYAGDFDHNSTHDIAMFYNRGSGEYPVNSLDEMKKQYPAFMANKFRTYGSFAGKNMAEILGDELSKSLRMEANEFSSLVLINNNGEFTSMYLPALAQSAPLCGLGCMDMNDDGYLDILGIGNNFSTRPQHGFDDAMNGILILNQKGNWKAQNGVKSGLLVRGDGKALCPIVVGENTYWIASQNNGKTLIFKNKNNQRFLSAQPNEVKAIVSTANGSYTVNTCYGSGYLTSAYPGVYVGKAVKSVEFVSANGQKRKAM